MQGHIALLVPAFTRAKSQTNITHVDPSNGQTQLTFIIFDPPRSPALIGCFVVDRMYFEEIGLLDEGMEVYGGENVELGIRVSNDVNSCGPWPLFIQVMCG